LQTQRGNGFGKPSVDDTGLDHRATLNRIDSEDPVQARERDEDRISVGQRTTGQAGAGSTCDEGHLDEVEQTKQLTNLVRRPWHDHDTR
jgi:hypothetical protein